MRLEFGVCWVAMSTLKLNDVSMAELWVAAALERSNRQGVGASGGGGGDDWRWCRMVGMCSGVVWGDAGVALWFAGMEWR